MIEKPSSLMYDETFQNCTKLLKVEKCKVVLHPEIIEIKKNQLQNLQQDMQAIL